MMLHTIHLLITACLIGSPLACSDIRAQTPYRSVEECQGKAQPFLAQVMAGHPAWRVARYKCEAVTVGREA